jgi:ferritin-like metal-binding protein YciE
LAATLKIRLPAWKNLQTDRRNTRRPNCNPITNIIKDEFCLDEANMPLLNDLDIMLYVQVLEHINITSYRMLIMIAKLLKYDEAEQLLIENFDESADNDKLFTLIAKEYVTSEGLKTAGDKKNETFCYKN